MIAPDSAQSGTAKRVLMAIGTRPEAIKLGPVYEALARRTDIEPIAFLTGQHEQQLEDGLSLFSIEPVQNLRVMSDRQDLVSTAGRILSGLVGLTQRFQPDYLLVQGDTLTTFCLAWAAFLEGIPVGHVEAGLRTGDLSQPFPEEANRRLVDTVASLLLAPTNLSATNLLAEGYDRSRVVITGQTGIDAVLKAARISQPPDFIPEGKEVVTITLHRRENWSALPGIAAALGEVARAWPELWFVYPVHLNPVVREAVWEPLSDLPNVLLTDPLQYGSMAALLSRSHLVITDSGGIQEETAALGIPTLVVRAVTERPEGLESGHMKLIGYDPTRVRESVMQLLGNHQELSAMSTAPNPFGDGKASDRVAEAVAWSLGMGERPPDWEVNADVG